ncbi:MAG TPA: flagellar biosynthetic protein FliO, partial [Pseudolabrys sp.]|nr:flagellar biosynthetic protein FliO [Pseudolabrys sp.]
MFDLFGSELPLAARFFIAFLVVLALIGLTAWVVRRFGANRLGGAGARGRQPRLAVIDAATVDGRRRLVLIRRDNVEHLLMIGGPSDVVIEPNIVRAAAAREPARPEPGMRVGPGTETPWPLQPSTEPPQVAQPRPFRAPASEEPWTPPEPGARSRPAESLSGLAAELSTKLTPPESPEPSVELPETRVAPPPAPAPSPAPVGRDRNLSDMAQQLEAALRRAPMVENRPPVTDPLAGQAHPQSAPAARVEPKIEP